MAKAAFNQLAFAPPAGDVLPLADRGRVLRSPQALGPYGRRVGEYLAHQGATTPDRLFLAERACQSTD